MFRKAAVAFTEACDRFVVNKDPSTWPSALRIKSVTGAPGILEMTWSFSGPDGRATWEWTTVRDQGSTYPAVRWRRLGGHEIFRAP